MVIEQGESSEIDNFIPLLTDAVDNISNEDYELFIKHCCATNELCTKAGGRSLFEHKWWLKDQKSYNESRKTSMPDAADTMCPSYANRESDNVHHTGEEKPRFNHKDLENLLEKFQKRIESDKNYKYYTEDPALAQNHVEISSSVAE